MVEMPGICEVCWGMARHCANLPQEGVHVCGTQNSNTGGSAKHSNFTSWHMCARCQKRSNRTDWMFALLSFCLALVLSFLDAFPVLSFVLGLFTGATVIQKYMTWFWFFRSSRVRVCLESQKRLLTLNLWIMLRQLTLWGLLELD